MSKIYEEGTRSEQPTVGEETEFAIVSVDNYKPVPRAEVFEREVEKQTGIELHAEFSTCMIEYASPVARSVGELEEIVRRDLKQIAEVGLTLGIAPVLVGKLPNFVYLPGWRRKTKRNDKIHSGIGDSEKYLCTQGLHIHSGIVDRAPEAVNALAAEVPTFVALSANSPDLKRNRDRSIRSRFWSGKYLPLSGLPPVIESWTHWHHRINVLKQENKIASLKDCWWLVRNAEQHQTVELRALDTPLKLSHLFSLVALTQAIVARVAKGFSVERIPEIDRHNLDQAISFGAKALFLTYHGERETLKDRVNRLVEMYSPIAAEFGSLDYLQGLPEIVSSTGADRQQRIFDEAGCSIDAVMEFLVEESLRELTGSDSQHSVETLKRERIAV